MVLLNLNEKQKEKIAVFNQFDDSSIVNWWFLTAIKLLLR